MDQSKKINKEALHNVGKNAYESENSGVEDTSAADVIHVCFDLYKSLPKSCKPRPNEWNVVAGIVMQDERIENEEGFYQCVALASGTKCIGKDKLCANGYILNDSHAEILVRRSFLRYLYNELELAIKAGCKNPSSSIFEWNETDRVFVLKSGIKFHFMSTRIPCGDACIQLDMDPVDVANDAPTQQDSEAKSGRSSAAPNFVFTGAKIIEGCEDLLSSKESETKFKKADKRKSINDFNYVARKIQIKSSECVKNLNDNNLMVEMRNSNEVNLSITPTDTRSVVHDTDEMSDNLDVSNSSKMKSKNRMADVIVESKDDPLRQTIAMERTKPGRGNRTLSMSCSDKLAKWQLMGVQGGLLSTILSKPVYFTSLTFCDVAPNSYMSEALERAIWKRFSHSKFANSKYTLHYPIVNILKRKAEMDFNDLGERPSATSFIWTNLRNNSEKSLEISVNGWKLGATKKILYTLAASVNISRYNLYMTYCNLLKKLPSIRRKLKLNYANSLRKLNYCQIKSLAIDYKEAWLHCKNTYFKCWTKKPSNCMNFTLKESCTS